MTTLKLELDDDTSKRLRRLVQHLPKAPRTVGRAVRIALYLLERCVEAQDAGGVVLVRDAEGHETELRIGRPPP